MSQRNQQISTTIRHCFNLIRATVQTSRWRLILQEMAVKPLQEFFELDAAASLPQLKHAQILTQSKVYKFRSVPLVKTLVHPGVPCSKTCSIKMKHQPNSSALCVLPGLHLCPRYSKEHEDDFLEATWHASCFAIVASWRAKLNKQE